MGCACRDRECTSFAAKIFSNAAVLFILLLCQFCCTQLHERVAMGRWLQRVVRGGTDEADATRQPGRWTDPDALSRQHSTAAAAALTSCLVRFRSFLLTSVMYGVGGASTAAAAAGAASVGLAGAGAGAGGSTATAAAPDPASFSAPFPSATSLLFFLPMVVCLLPCFYEFHVVVFSSVFFSIHFFHPSLSPFDIILCCCLLLLVCLLG